LKKKNSKKMHRATTLKTAIRGQEETGLRPVSRTSIGGGGKGAASKGAKGSCNFMLKKCKFIIYNITYKIVV
jgi:hypothetical protein